MSAYQPPAFSAPIDLDLSKNEGRPSIDNLDMDRAAAALLTSRYPDFTRLSGQVAARHAVPVERVLVTAGGDDALFRCFLRCNGPVVATTPSFEMIARYSEQLGLQLIEVPWWDGDFPVAPIVDTPAEMAILVSPNNPTGSVLTAADLCKVADGVPFVVLDGAYMDFADEDLTKVALELDNVVVVRTLSKAFGLAGLRVGYALGPPSLIAQLGRYGSPYSLSALSSALAADVLERNPEHAERFAALIVDERTRLADALADLGVGSLPSQGNFVLATGVDAEWFTSAAASLGIALRRFPDRPELAGCVRITLPGDPDDFDRLEHVLRTVVEPEALLFDMDGVLADVSDSFRAAIVATAAGYGVTVTPDQIAAAKAAGNASDDWELTRGLLAAVGVEATYEEVRDSFESIYQGTSGQPGLKMGESLLPDRELLERLSQRWPLGIVTARPRKDAEEFLERFGIGMLFQVVVTREDAPSKPDPAPVRLALERLGVDRAWLAGDTRDDLEAARAASVLPIAVVVPGDDLEAVTAAARVLTSIQEITEVLDVA